MSLGMLGKLPLAAVRGPKDALDERLAGANGEKWLEELNKFLAKKPTWVTEFETLLVMFLGDYTNTANIINEIRRQGYRIGSFVEGLAPVPLEHEELARVDVVKVTPSQLGFTQPAPRKDIYSRALKKGLRLFTLEGALSLRLWYKDQPKGTAYLEVAMQLAPDRDRDNAIILEHSEGNLSISGHMRGATQVDLLDPHQEIAFTFPQSSM